MAKVAVEREKEKEEKAALAFNTPWLRVTLIFGADKKCSNRSGRVHACWERREDGRKSKVRQDYPGWTGTVSCRRFKAEKTTT